MGGFPSGQRGQTVNLLALPSKVRILLRPFDEYNSSLLHNMIYLMCSFEGAIFQKSLSLNCESDWPGGSAG